MMIIGGGLSIVFGLVAALNDQWVAFTNAGAVFLDVSQWGWVHILLGLLVLLCGFGVLSEISSHARSACSWRPPTSWATSS